MGQLRGQGRGDFVAASDITQRHRQWLVELRQARDCSPGPRNAGRAEDVHGRDEGRLPASVRVRRDALHCPPHVSLARARRCPRPRTATPVAGHQAHKGPAESKQREPGRARKLSTHARTSPSTCHRPIATATDACHRCTPQGRAHPTSISEMNTDTIICIDARDPCTSRITCRDPDNPRAVGCWIRNIADTSDACGGMIWPRLDGDAGAACCDITQIDACCRYDRARNCRLHSALESTDFSAVRQNQRAIRRSPVIALGSMMCGGESACLSRTAR